MEINNQIHLKALENCEKAVTLVNLCKNKMAKKNNARKVLTEYEQAIKGSARLMIDLNIWQECAICGSSPKGSCCAPEVALWYDIETLVINLMLGCVFPSSPYKEDHCLFLGPEGCLLKGRHYYCVTFMCKRLSIPEGEKLKLFRAIGKEVLLGSELIKIVKDFIA